MALIKDRSIMCMVSGFLTFQEYSKLGAVNRAFYEELRNSIGAMSLIHFIKVRYVDQQHQYTVTFKGGYKSGGGPISARFAN